MIWNPTTTAENRKTGQGGVKGKRGPNNVSSFGPGMFLFSKFFILYLLSTYM